MWVRFVVRWLAMPLVPFLILFSFSTLRLDGQMENLFSTAAADAMETESGRAELASLLLDNDSFLAEPGIDEEARRTAARTLVQTDGFAEVLIESQRQFGAALDGGGEIRYQLDLSRAIDQAELRLDIHQALRRNPILDEGSVATPQVPFGRVGTITALAAIALAAIAILGGGARRTALHWLSLLALLAPLYLYVLNRVATTDEQAIAAIGRWLQQRYSTGLYLMAAIGVLCFVVARWDKRQELKQLDPELLNQVSMATAVSAHADTVSSSASISESST